MVLLDINIRDLINVWTMTLTFELVIWFLFVMIICAKLLINPNMHDQVMGQIRIGFTEAYAQSLSAHYDLDL